MARQGRRGAYTASSEGGGLTEEKYFAELHGALDCNLMTGCKEGPSLLSGSGAVDAGTLGHTCERKPWVCPGGLVGSDWGPFNWSRGKTVGATQPWDEVGDFLKVSVETCMQYSVLYKNGPPLVCSNGLCTGKPLSDVEPRERETRSR